MAMDRYQYEKMLYLQDQELRRMRQYEWQNPYQYDMDRDAFAAQAQQIIPEQPESQTQDKRLLLLEV